MTVSGELNNLFDQAQKAFQKRDWQTTSNLLIEILSKNPVFPGAYDLLVETGKGQKAEANYKEGLEYFERRDWAQAIDRMEATLRDDPDHPDALVKLNIAKQWTELKQLEDKAERHFQDSEWKQAVETFEDLLGLKDPALDFDWSSIERQLEIARDELEHMHTYQKCLSHMDREEWSDAQECFMQLREKKPGYRDVDVKLREIAEEIELEGLYYQATGAEQNRNWDRALDLYEQILNRDRDYKDVLNRMVKCKERKERKEDKRASVHWFWPLLLGFIVTGIIARFYAQSIHCLIHHRLTETLVVIICALVGFVVMYFANLIPTNIREVIREVLTPCFVGVAIVLLACVVWMGLIDSPPSEEECSGILPPPSLALTTTPSPTLRSPTPTDTPTTTSTPSITPTDTPTATTTPSPTPTEIPTTTSTPSPAPSSTSTPILSPSPKTTLAAIPDATVTQQAIDAIATANAVATQQAIGATATACALATQQAIATATAEAMMRPVLEEPEEGALFTPVDKIHFKWRWYRELEENEFFALRLWHKEIPAEKHSFTWEKKKDYILDLKNAPIDDIDFTEGYYYWNVAAVRKNASGWELIAESEKREIYINVPPPDTPTPTKPPTPTPITVEPP